MSFAQNERQALIDTFRSVGPDAPTLCDGWTTTDLLEHLIMREIHPLAGVSSKIPFDALSKAGKEKKQEIVNLSYDKKVDYFAEGRQSYSLLNVNAIDSMFNTAEYVVHHEDILRAQDTYQPRSFSHAHNMTLMRINRVVAPILCRKLPVALTFDAGEYDSFTVGSEEKQQTGIVTLTGTPLELLLFTFGRDDRVDVTFSGDPGQIDAVKNSERSL